MTYTDKELIEALEQLASLDRRNGGRITDSVCTKAADRLRSLVSDREDHERQYANMANAATDWKGRADRLTARVAELEGGLRKIIALADEIPEVGALIGPASLARSLLPVDGRASPGAERKGGEL